MNKLKDIYAREMPDSSGLPGRYSQSVLLMPFGKHLNIEQDGIATEDEELFEAIDYAKIMPDGPPPERRMVELLSGDDSRRQEAIDFIRDMSPSNQLWLLHAFNQPGYSSEIDGEYYDQRDKWIIAYSFNKIASEAPSALVALTSRIWLDRMTHRSSSIEPSEERSFLDFSSGRDVAYSARIRMPEDWRKLAGLSHVAPGVVAAKDHQGLIRRVARISAMPDNLSLRDVNLLNAHARASALSRNSVYYKHTERQTVDAWVQQLGEYLEGDDIAYVGQTESLDDLLDRVDDLLDRNQSIRLDKGDFVGINEVAGFDDSEARVLFQLAHRSGVREVLEEVTGVDLSEITLETQVQLLRYMAARTEEEFSRLLRAAGAAKETLGSTATFYEAFLATEFGDDFGDKLLSIAEHIPQEELGRVLADLERARMGARGVMDWYRDVDEHFAEMALPAIAERITDMITTLEVAARHKSLRIDIGPGNDPEVESQFIYTATWEQAAKDLHDLADNLESDGWILNDPGTVVSRVVVESDKFARFRLLNSRLGTMVLNIRSYGTLTRGDAQYEVGSFKNGVEAAINMLSNRHDPYGISPTADMRTFSLRFDREGRAPDVAASDRSQRKATNKEGTVAVDVASIWSFGDDNEPATRVGRAIAAGSRLRAEAIGTKDELNHNMLVDQSYGNADVFAELAHKVIAKLDAQAKRTSKKQLATVARTLVQLRDDHQLAA